MPRVFEKVAPSTYCVPVAFRKDHVDVESILSEARKKIQIFDNGFLAEEDVKDKSNEGKSNFLNKLFICFFLQGLPSVDAILLLNFTYN